MDPKQAQQVLYTKVYVPAFLQKCAELGLPISTREEAAIALENAALVRHACDKLNKSATQGVLKQANSILRNAVGAPKKETKVNVDNSVAEAILALG